MRSISAIMLTVLLAAASLAGCGGPPPVRPLTDEESKALERQLEAVEAFERTGGRGPG